MYPEAYIDRLRKDAYPVAAPEGDEYERARLRECLEAAAGFKKQGGGGHALLVAKDEAERVLKVALREVYGNPPTPTPSP
jgi:hypothetical protein